LRKRRRGKGKKGEGERRRTSFVTIYLLIEVNNTETSGKKTGKLHIHLVGQDGERKKATLQTAQAGGRGEEKGKKKNASVRIGEKNLRRGLKWVVLDVIPTTMSIGKKKRKEAKTGA